MSEELKTIRFGSREEVDPSKALEYKKRIENATSGVNALKGQTPLGVIPRPTNVPILSGNIAELPSGLDQGVTPRPAGSPVIRPETAKQVAAFQKAQEKQIEQTIEEETKKELEQAAEDEALYDRFAPTPRNENERILDNKQRRKAIESRCSEMSIDDLIMKGEVRQTVPILPNKFTVIFRSTLPEENIFVKKLIAKDEFVNDAVTLETYSLYQLCLAVVQVNNSKLTHHMNEKNEPDEKLFREKFSMMMKMSGYTINDLSVNLRWFDVRVRKLMNPDALGNG